MILSICIPSYSRFCELKKLLDSISRARSRDFDVYILDNGSKEDIFCIGSYDDRFHFIRRDGNVPGPVNIRDCLNYGDGKYIMLCLDKDYVHGRYLDHFIEELNNQSDITCGYCILNSSVKDGKIISHGRDISKSIYRCGHPSGYFFRIDVVKIDERDIDVFDKKSIFYNDPFLPDLVYARGVTMGKEGIYNGILVTPETPEKASMAKSHTYSIQNQNIHFMPDRKREQFFLFLKHMEVLGLENKTKKRIILRLLRKTMISSTLDYRSIMKNEQICLHHSLACRDIRLKEIFQEAGALTKMFYMKNIENCSMIFKIEAILVSWSVLMIRILFKAGRDRL